MEDKSSMGEMWKLLGNFPALLGQPNISKDAYSAYIQVE